MGTTGSVLVVLMPFVFLFLYFLPALEASRRKHPKAGAIWVLNIFLGGTFIGWVVALVMTLWHKEELKETKPVEPEAAKTEAKP